MDFLEFENGGRTLTCRSASSPGTPGTMWWWIDVTGESQRYATFRTSPSDRPENLKPRIVAAYQKVLDDRARPREVRPRWVKPAAPAVSSAETPASA